MFRCDKCPAAKFRYEYSLLFNPLFNVVVFSQGRNPFFLEPAIIIAITDGNKLTSSGGVQEEVCCFLSASS